MHYSKAPVYDYDDDDDDDVDDDDVYIDDDDDDDHDGNVDSNSILTKDTMDCMKIVICKFAALSYC